MPLANVTVRYTSAEIAHFYETDRWRRETLPELVACAACAGGDRVMVDDTTSPSYSQLQVEDLFSEHPAVRRVAVVGMPDERLGERLCCFVERAHADEPLALDDLTAFLRDRDLAVQKLPERLELIETMPLNPTDKIQKHLLRDLAGTLSEVDAASSWPAGKMAP